MGCERIADLLLQCPDFLPVHRMVEVVDRIEVQHIRDRSLERRAEDAADPDDALLLMEKARMQPSADVAMTHTGESTRDIGRERDRLHGLQDDPLISKDGLCRQVRIPVQTHAPEQHRIDLRKRQNAHESPVHAVQNLLPHQAVQRHAERVGIADPKEDCEITGVEERLLRPCQQRDALG